MKRAATQNVTLSLPVSLLRQFKVYAAKQNQSMSKLAADAIRKMVERKEDRDRAARELLEHFRNAPDRGIGGKITWTREELHERGAIQPRATLKTAVRSGLK